jgi:hypothetical protein
MSVPSRMASKPLSVSGGWEACSPISSIPCLTSLGSRRWMRHFRPGADARSARTSLPSSRTASSRGFWTILLRAPLGTRSPYWSMPRGDRPCRAPRDGLRASAQSFPLRDYRVLGRCGTHYGQSRMGRPLPCRDIVVLDWGGLCQLRGRRRDRSNSRGVWSQLRATEADQTKIQPHELLSVQPEHSAFMRLEPNPFRVHCIQRLGSSCRIRRV